MRCASSASTTRAVNSSSLAIGQPTWLGKGPGAVDPAVGGGEKAEFGVLATDPHVEGRRQHRRPAISQPVDHADHRLGTGRELQAAPAAAHLVEFGRGVAAIVLALLMDVAAGGKRAAGAG